MKTIEKLIQEYYSKHSNIEQYRMGQWWCNEYGWDLGVCPWSQLFYCESTVECVKILDQWLRDNGYENRNLPKKTQEKTNDSE